MIDDTKETEDDVVEDANVSTANATGEGNSASLSINDLANMKQIIDVAAARGAFKTNEFKVVGETCDRLVAFLESVAPSTPEEVDAETATEDSTDEVDAEA